MRRPTIVARVLAVSIARATIFLKSLKSACDLGEQTKTMLDSCINAIGNHYNANLLNEH